MPQDTDLTPVAPKPRARTEKAKLGGTGSGGTAMVPQQRELATVGEESIEQDGIIYAEPILIRPNNSARARISEFVILKTQGFSNIDIAGRMGIKPSTLNTLISRATREGWLKLDDPEERLELELKPIVVDNVKEYLTSKDNDAARLKMTIEAAKGVGLFKSHQAVKVEGQAQQMVLALRFETPDVPQIIEGHVLGTPKIPTEHA